MDPVPSIEEQIDGINPLGVAELEIGPLSTRMLMLTTLFNTMRKLMVDSGFNQERAETYVLDFARQVTGVTHSPAE
jgi:hypothetical protein